MASVPRFLSVSNVDHVAVGESVVKAVQTLGYDCPPPVSNVDHVAVGESVVKAVQTLGYDCPPPVKRPSTGGNSSASGHTI